MNIEEMRKQILPVNFEEPFIFVSYSKKDAEKVYPIILELQKKGVNLYIDINEFNISWQVEAFKIMSNPLCEKILFFMSKNSFFSIPVLAELTFSINELTKLNHGGEKLWIVPIIMDDNINMGEIIASCKEDERYGIVIGKESYNTFSLALDDKKDEIDDKCEYADLIKYVYEVVFNAEPNLTVVSGEVDGILMNIPDSVKNNKV